MLDYVCVRCRDGLRSGTSHLTCAGCGGRYPIVSTIPIVVPRPDALLIDLSRTLDGASRQFELARQRLLESAVPERSAGFRDRAERWCRGVDSNLGLIRTHTQDVGAYVASLGSRELNLLDWVSLQHSGWGTRHTLPYFYQDWAGTAEFDRVRALIGGALAQFAPDRQRAIVLGAGACGIARAAADLFDRVSALDLSLATLLLARALLAGNPLEIQLEGAAWRTARVSAPPDAPRGHLQLAVTDASSLPVAADTQSAVVTQFLMDLVGNPLHVIDEIHRVLQPGGIWINFSIPFFLPGEPGEVGPPSVQEVSRLLDGRGWRVRQASRERFTLNNLETLHDGGVRTNHEVHFFVASKRPGGVASRHWFSAADWGACRVSLVPGRKVEVTRSSSGDGRATIRVGQAVVTADAAQADAIEALFGLIDGQRSLNEIIAALTPAVTFTEIEWRELFHYLADRYGLLELAAPGTDLGRT